VKLNVARKSLKLRGTVQRSPELATRGDLLWIRSDYLRPDAEQPRRDFDEDTLEELAASIEDVGILTALRVRPPDGDGIHTITDGERRWRAGQRAGVMEYPCLVEAADATQAFLEAYLANLHRDALSPVDAAAGVQQIRHTYQLASDDEVASKLRKSLGWVRQMNAVAALDTQTKTALLERREPAAVAVGLRPQSPTERAATLDAISDLTSRDAKVDFIGRINDQRRAGKNIKEAIEVARGASTAIESDRVRARSPGVRNRVGRPTRITLPFAREPGALGSQQLVAHPAALATTRLAGQRIALPWQWREAICADITAFRDACADGEESGTEWQKTVEEIRKLID
jgi:ParB/RepB/Spo0J family partition protein